jgi:hypothetical protein
MGKTADEIVNDIDYKREQLKSNLEELETRVKSVTDWRSYFEKYPGKMILGALVGGVVLAAMIGKRTP